MGDSKNWSNFAAKQPLTMEQKFGKNSIDIKALREFCEREGKMVEYRKGEQLEREGAPHSTRLFTIHVEPDKYDFERGQKYRIVKEFFKSGQSNPQSVYCNFTIE